MTATAAGVTPDLPRLRPADDLTNFGRASMTVAGVGTGYSVPQGGGTGNALHGGVATPNAGSGNFGSRWGPTTRD
jgi:hypothetical protein